MATYYSPKIVTDGLVLCLDAGNAKSYPARCFVSAKIYSVYSGGARSANYTVQYSDDNTNWTTAFSGIARNNESGSATCGINNNTGSGSASYGRHRYWRYVEGSAVISHHPRVSRIILVDDANIEYNLIVYVSDNCSDSGTYIIGTVSVDVGATIFTDLSGNGTGGTLTNTPTFNNLNNGSIVFNGTNNYIPITIPSNLIRLYDATIFFVIKLPLYSGGQRCILSYRGGSGGNLYIGKNSSGIFCFYNELNTAAYIVGSITDNTIAIVAVALNATGTTLSTYINGSLAGSVTRTGWNNAYNTILNLGYDAGGTNEYMLGNFYCFAHYNKVLSASEVLQNFNALRGRFGL